MPKLCRALRIASKGYFVQNIDLSNDRFAQQTLRLEGQDEDIPARNCELLKANDLSQKIFIAEKTKRATLMTLIACRQPDQCWIESFANMDVSLFKKFSKERKCNLISYYYSI